MIPWKHLDTSPTPDNNGELRLYRRDEEYSIRIDGMELMNSRRHNSEDELAELTCSRIADRPGVSVLIGGLGMGYTLASALSTLRKDSQITVAELVPAVVAWNRDVFGHVAGHPLKDGRVRIEQTDVVEILKGSCALFDAVILDVDNGPDGLTQQSNDWLYGGAGLSAIKRALKPRGILSVWSAGYDRPFSQRLHKARFKVEEFNSGAREGRKGGRHTIWLATS